jgi:hypothetical protein
MKQRQLTVIEKQQQLRYRAGYAKRHKQPHAHVQLSSGLVAHKLKRPNRLAEKRAMRERARCRCGSSRKPERVCECWRLHNVKKERELWHRLMQEHAHHKGDHHWTEQVEDRITHLPSNRHGVGYGERQRAVKGVSGTVIRS